MTAVRGDRATTDAKRVDPTTDAKRVDPTTARLQVDWTRCDGHGLCAALLPGVIAQDEWGYPVIDRTRPISEREARRVVGACPALALRLAN